LALATIVALAGQAVGQITFTKCSLAAELLRQGFAMETLPDCKSTIFCLLFCK